MHASPPGLADPVSIRAARPCLSAPTARVSTKSASVSASRASKVTLRPSAARNVISPKNGSALGPASPSVRIRTNGTVVSIATGTPPDSPLVTEPDARRL